MADDVSLIVTMLSEIAPAAGSRAAHPAELVSRLRERGAPALARLDSARLLDAWGDTVAAFLDPASAERRALDPALAESCGLSREGLEAGLAAVLGGVRREAAERLAERISPPATGAATPALVLLAANLPALAVQPLLPALLARRPVILKSPSAEPLFAPAFVRALAARERALGEAIAALTWRGGDAELEAPLLAACDPVLAYGERETIDDLRRRARGRVVAHGPKVSLAVVSGDAELERAAEGIARDVALFDQRGCLSIHAVYTDGDAPALASHLARALEDLARSLPPGPIEPAIAAAVQQLRAEAELRGLVVAPRALRDGTVVVEPEGAFRPSPGLRAVRVHALADLSTLPDRLAPWSGRLQGAALAGTSALALEEHLAALGFSRFAPPGELQSPDATWHNGGVDPAELF